MIALFDSSVSHSFISENVVRKLALLIYPLDDVLNVVLPTGTTISVTSCVNRDHNQGSNFLELFA
ncbi:hypothetical protein AXF42_Ash020612 [Apostasia shenzhenica]|uniref:Uncharacterized protein n=1 Tax=Apostasia shenzhenica TaxID=1088818 RepID=A0A2I0A0F9_9ASPA|nr:hypothetical protein AXF42_Ash020612 [Apostasia shenzhenica]